jgi:hypothetical protein
MSLTRRREKPLSELSDKALMRKIADANRSIERVPDRPPHSELATHLGVMEAAGRERKAARQELARREQAAKDAKDAPIRRVIEKAQERREVGRAAGSRTRRPLPASRTRGRDARRRPTHRGRRPRTAQARCTAARRRATPHRRGTAPLRDACCEDDGRPGHLRARTNRASRAGEARRASSRPAASPQAADLLAATAGDPEVLDALRHILRPGAVEVDEFGREIHGKHDARLFELEDVGVLFVLVATIVSNGGDSTCRRAVCSATVFRRCQGGRSGRSAKPGTSATPR